MLSSQDYGDSQLIAKIIQRRDYLANLYKSLPYWDSQEFWQVVEQGDFPLEVLVKLSRLAFRLQDYDCEKRISTIIVLRLQHGIQSWAAQTAKKYPLSMLEEHQRLAADLSADLYEAILRAIRDPQRLFWEENFFHCLLYERRHVYRAFLMREGCWHDTRVGKCRRIPFRLISSLDRPIYIEGQGSPLELEDENAYHMLLSIESSDIGALVACLPERLRSVIHQIFWEDRSEKEIANALAVTDRTVRNRLQTALNQLHHDFIMLYQERRPFLS